MINQIIQDTFNLRFAWVTAGCFGGDARGTTPGPLGHPFKHAFVTWSSRKGRQLALSGPHQRKERMVSTRAVGLIGFVRCSLKPLSRQRRRSSSNAWAVNATIGRL